jgi:hypothetical protein
MSGGDLDGPDSNVIDGSMVFPAGTTEQYPDMANSLGTTLDDTAHYYMECSNKGLCNRKDGECECFDGYEGSSCQRASCPNECSGHGVCKNIRQIAEDDAWNFYELWDKYATLGCVCDAEYYGADCSSRRCKYGVDPLFIDDAANARFAQFDIIMDGDAAVPSGTYSIVFTDVFGENWETSSIMVSDDPCTDIIAALEGIPNNVIPADSIECSFAASTNVYTTSLQFMGNPGHITPPSVNQHLSGSTPTLTTSTVEIQSSGTRGEFADNVPTQCSGVTVTVGWATDVATMTILDDDSSGDNTGELYALKTCLGTSDMVSSTNTDVNNWDLGANGWPHLVKVVESDTTDGGYYNLLEYDDTNDVWDLLFDVPTDNALEIFTTDATMELLYTDTDSSDLLDGVEAAFAIQGDPTGGNKVELDGDASCESGAATVSNCLQKGDVVMMGSSTSAEDVVAGEFYTITRVWTVAALDEAQSDTYFFSVDHAMNSDADNVYVLTVNDESYEYVSECSNRGLCNSEEGVCECFSGYTNDNCDMQSAVAV